MGLKSNWFHKFWWIMICRHPHMKYEGKHKENTEDHVLRLIYKKGPQTRVRQGTSTQGKDYGPPISQLEEGGLGKCYLVSSDPRRAPRVGALWQGVAPTLPQARKIMFPYQIWGELTSSYKSRKRSTHSTHTTSNPFSLPSLLSLLTLGYWSQARSSS